MFNPYLDSWIFDKSKRPSVGVPVFILVECDVIEGTTPRDHPFVKFAEYLQYEREPRIYYWKIIDFDPEYEEEILQQYYSVVAWRYAS